MECYIAYIFQVRETSLRLHTDELSFIPRERDETSQSGRSCDDHKVEFHTRDSSGLTSSSGPRVLPRIPILDGITVKPLPHNPDRQPPHRHGDTGLTMCALTLHSVLIPRRAWATAATGRFDSEGEWVTRRARVSSAVSLESSNHLGARTAPLSATRMRLTRADTTPSHRTPFLGLDVMDPPAASPETPSHPPPRNLTC